MAENGMKGEVTEIFANDSVLLNDLCQMIKESRNSVAVTINRTITLLYWQIGQRINREVLKGQRAVYGKRILATVSQQLVAEFGEGFSYTALSRMIKFYEYFQDEKIVATLSQQLSWSHFRELLPLNEPLKRDFYAALCRIENWSVRTLRKKIASMLYERTALSKKPEKLIKQEIEKLSKTDQLTPDLIFRDPYFLDFLGLKDRYLEKDLEDAILREIETFILEIGVGFTFVARQKRMTIDDEDFYLDLLFFHRSLRRLVAIELKLDHFRPEYKGQMELYLRWLDKYERQQHEESPLGLILCSGKREEQIELLELSSAGIHVAEYLIELPSKNLLQKKLHSAITIAREKYEQK
jgi:predicted nuclease of restriction endonuclease-like (RecB) superfamily